MSETNLVNDVFWQYISSLLESINIRLLSIKNIAEKSKPIWLITTSQGKYVLKSNRQKTSWKSWLRKKILGSLGFDRECWFYKSIGPELPIIANSIVLDKNNILIELLPLKEGRRWEVEDNEWKVLIDSLLMFHWEVVPKNTSLRSYIHRWIYGPQGVAIRIGFLTVLKEYGLWTALMYIREITICISKQPKLPEQYLSHNDLMPNNILFSEDSSQAFFIDFQDVTKEARWPLYDIIRLSWHLKGVKGKGIDFDQIQEYCNGLPMAIKSKINMRVQLKFSLLLCVMHSIRWRKLHKQNYSELSNLLKDIITNNKKSEYYSSIMNSI
jgi:hypothetical protein